MFFWNSNIKTNMIKSCLKNNDEPLSTLRLGEMCTGKITSRNLETCFCVGCFNRTLDTYDEFQMDSDPVIDQTHVEEGTSKSNTTTFVDNAVGIVSAPVKPVQFPYANSNSDLITDDRITEFLSKPVIATTLSLSGASTDNLYSEVVGKSLLDDTVIHGDKLKGFYGISFTAVYTLKVTADRFTTGLLTLAFMPSGGIPDGTNLDDMFTTYCHSKTQRSQLLHVNYDINTDSSATLEIPFSGIAPYMVLSTSLVDYIHPPGKIGVFVYSGLNSISSLANANATLYVSYKDVKLFGYSDYQSNIHNDLDYDEFQSGRKGKTSKNVLDVEADSDRRLSGGLKMIHTISDKLSTIPLLSSIAGPVSWVSDALARAAYLWGYSAPTVVSAPGRFIETGVPYLANFDKHSTAIPLGLSVSNSVGISNVTGTTDQDEMSIDFLKGIFSYFDSFIMNTTHAADYTLYSKRIGPKVAHTTVSHGVTLQNRTTIGHLAHLYAKWRGTLKIKLIFVKTEFHIGRIAINFRPAYRSASASYNPSKAPLYYREILDLRKGNEFIFSIPFINQRSWLYTANTADHCGDLYITVVDPLRVGDVANTGFTVLMEICGGPDLEFAERVDLNSLGYPVDVDEFQSNIERVGEIGTEVLGTHSESSKGVGPSQYCIGEAYESLLQLVKAGGIARTYIDSDTAADWLLVPDTVIMARLAFFGRLRSGSYLLRYDKDLFTAVTCLYANSRGGMRITLTRTDGVTSTLTSSLYTPSYSTGPFAFKASYRTSNLARSCGYTISNGISHCVEDAMYGNYPSYCNWTYRDNVSSTGFVGQDDTMVNHHIVIGPTDLTDTTSYYTIHRAGKDDFRCSNFISVPPYTMSVPV
eukprot:NODE_128_length_3134_cov_38.006159_g118_i0.p1 GENE.NODE_128_length_3134_cov_38.006159_g118_i0~~NODE_128_length_3134_cov_38.006159_g118_i0.p1  ORF type:complete len:866 (-),score=-71.78 NODE_128_length_3134_cov_38.006159_g118_i0:192-2789(-)